MNMGEIKNSQKGVKSGVPESVNISCPTCGTRHELPKTTGNNMRAEGVGLYSIVPEVYVSMLCSRTIHIDMKNIRRDKVIKYEV